MIKMLKNCPGSVNGISVKMYMAGEVYSKAELGEDLVKSFLNSGMATEFVEQKDAGKAPKNKAAGPVESKDAEKEDPKEEDPKEEDPKEEDPKEGSGELDEEALKKAGIKPVSKGGTVVRGGRR